MLDWPPETKAVVAAAVVVSLCSLATWGGSVWMYLQPSAFPNSRLMLDGPFSFDFLRFVLHAAAHTVVIVGALLFRVNPRLARRLLLAGAGGALALALYQFAAFTIFQTGLSQPRQGPDQVVFAAIDGARLVGMNVVHALLVMMLLPARAGAPTGRAASTGWRPETQLIVAAAAIGAVTDLLSNGATVWMSLQPHLFKRIGAGDWTAFGLVLFGVRVVLHLAILAGAAAMLMRRERRSSAARWLLLVGAAGLLALSLYGYVHSIFWLPAGMPRYQGAPRITTTVYGVSGLITLGMIHALVIFAMTRRRPHA